MRTQAERNEVWASQQGEADLHGFMMDAPFYMPAGGMTGWIWPVVQIIQREE